MARYEVYDCNEKILSTFNELKDAHDYLVIHKAQFIYDCHKHEIVEGEEPKLPWNEDVLDINTCFPL